MGWSNCGTDSKGRQIGYAITAYCDQPSCANKIDRGLSYACGGMHGETEVGCEGYFCEDHLSATVETDGQLVRVCNSCKEQLLVDTDCWFFNEDEGIFQSKGML